MYGCRQVGEWAFLAKTVKISNFLHGRWVLSAGAPGEIRTPDPQIRSLVLYPAELRALIPLPGNRAAEPRDSYRLGVSLARVAGVNADLPCSVWAQASAWFSTRMRVASSPALASEKTSANSGNPSASGTTAISATTTR